MSGLNQANLRIVEIWLKVDLKAIDGCGQVSRARANSLYINIAWMFRREDADRMRRGEARLDETGLCSLISRKKSERAG